MRPVGAETRVRRSRRRRAVRARPPVRRGRRTEEHRPHAAHVPRGLPPRAPAIPERHRTATGVGRIPRAESHRLRRSAQRLPHLDGTDRAGRRLPPRGAAVVHTGILAHAGRITDRRRRTRRIVRARSERPSSARAATPRSPPGTSRDPHPAEAGWARPRQRRCSSCAASPT